MTRLRVELARSAVQTCTGVLACMLAGLSGARSCSSVVRSSSVASVSCTAISDGKALLTSSGGGMCCVPSMACGRAVS